MMKDWIQFPPGSGADYPVSGRLIGQAATFLRLKGYLRDGWQGTSYKTAQRYFDGDRIDPENIDRILDRLVEGVLPEGPRGEDDDLRSTRRWARQFLGNAAQMWDTLLGSMLGGGFPVTERRLAPIPFLRLFVLDAAIRWAAFQGLRHHAARSEPDFDPIALERDGLRRVIDSLRAATDGRNLTLEKLAEQAVVSESTLEAWRAGTQFPTDESLKSLAAPLARHAALTPEEVEFKLRLAVGGGELRRQLAELCGGNVVSDLAATFSKVARLTFRWLRFAPIPNHLFAEVMVEIVEYGARATIRSQLTPYLADAAKAHTEVAADFLALPGRWGERLNYWCKMMAAFTPAGGFLNHIRGITAEEKERLRPEVEDRVLRMRFFDEEQAQHPHLFHAPDDANTRAKTAAYQGGLARSIGDTEHAAHHYREAVRHDPFSASYHYTLGCYLGELVSLGQLKYLDEAVSECRKAARLDPSWNSPLTEVAIIYSNVGMLEEAIKAFDEAEPVAKGWAHYHLTRGNTLMWLGRYEEAVAAFTRSYEIQPRMLDAMVHKAVALAILGRHREVERMAPQIAHRGGPRCATPEAWIAYYPRMSTLAQKLRKAGTIPPPIVPPPTPGVDIGPQTGKKVGRNELCPCGSGKKYKRCHGGPHA